MLTSLGAPAADTDETNPDWIPSLHVCHHNNSNSPGKMKRTFTKLKRCPDRKKICSASSSEQSSSNALELTQDTAKPMTVEEVQDIAETMAIEEIQDIAETMTVEEVHDTGETTTVQEVQDITESIMVEEVQDTAETKAMEEIQSTFDSEPTYDQNNQQCKSQSNSKMPVSGSDGSSFDSFSSSAKSDEDTLDSFSASDELLGVLILEAVKQNDRDGLLRVLKKCKENNFPRSGKITTSCWEAIRLATSDQSRKKCFESLLEFDNGILISVDERIAVHIGSKNDAEENILLLLQKGYEFHERRTGRSILHIAATRGDLTTVSFLSNHSKNIDIKDSQNRTPLHYSAMTGHLEVSRILLESGADVNSADDFGNVPLHYACSRGSIKSIHLLLECDLTTINHQNIKGVTPFFYALNDTMDWLDINYLLEKGARTDIITHSGMTAFEFGVSAERYDCLPLLLESVHVSRIETFCVYQISDRINSLNTETSYPEDIKSLTCSAVDIGSDCLTVLINRNLPKAILQAPSLIFYSGSFRVYSPLAFLLGIVIFKDRKLDQSLDLLLKHKITMLDEFQRKSQLQWPRSRIIYAHPFLHIINYRVPLSKKLYYFNLLNANGVTTDYCLQWYHDNSMPFATFTDYTPYYNPVINAVDDCDIEAVQMLISTSAILEPDILNKWFVTNLPDTLDKASADFQEICHVHEYLFNLKPVHYEYDQHVDPYFTAAKRFPPATLQQLCRTAIRQQLREPTLQDNLLNFQRKISELPLPNLLKDYLLFKI